MNSIMASTRTNNSFRLHRYIAQYSASDMTVMNPSPADSRWDQLGVNHPVFVRMLCPIEAVVEYDNNPAKYELHLSPLCLPADIFSGLKRSFKMRGSEWMLVRFPHSSGWAIPWAMILMKMTCAMGYSRGIYSSECIPNHPFGSTFDCDHLGCKTYIQRTIYGTWREATQSPCNAVLYSMATVKPEHIAYTCMLVSHYDIPLDVIN